MGRIFGDPNAIVTTLADRTKIGYHAPQQVVPSAQGRVHSSKTGPFHLVKVDIAPGIQRNNAIESAISERRSDPEPFSSFLLQWLIEYLVQLVRCQWTRRRNGLL